jgi:hypothetical protein
MAEIGTEGVGVVSVSATSGSLDALVVPGRATACRVADDELLLLSERAVANEIAREVETRLTVLDPDALVLDTTEGWAASVIEGDDARAIFGSLSRLRLPERGFLQGEVTHVPAKVLVEVDRILILVPAAFEHHLHSRLAWLDAPGPRT